MHDAPDRSASAGDPLPPGVRGAPRPPAGWDLLVRAGASLVGEVLDASGLTGLPAVAARRADAVTVLEPSAAGLAVARARAAGGDARDTLAVRAGLPWDAEPASADAVLLAPPAERGSARVEAELMAAARAVRPEGHVLLLLEKDRGAKRYERTAGAWFGAVRVVAKGKGHRLALLERPLSPSAAELDARVWHRFEAPGVGPAWSVAGTFASGKLDPGSALLLRTLASPPDGTPPPDPAGRTVLDLGCGWGPLAAWALDRGARVTASDDDLAAVRACRRTLDARPNGADATVTHADLDGGLAPELRAELALVNPPFHLGSGVRLALGQAFLTAAARRLAPDGEAWIVANEALPYERRYEGPGTIATVAREGGFKIVRVRVPASR